MYFAYFVLSISYNYGNINKHSEKKKKKDIHMQKEAPGAPVNNAFPEFAKMK